MPNGRIRRVLASPTASEKSVMCQVSSERKFNQMSVSGVEKISGHIPWLDEIFDLLFSRAYKLQFRLQRPDRFVGKMSIEHHKTVLLEGVLCGGTLEVGHEIARRVFALRFFDDRGGVGNLRSFVDWHFVDDLNFLGNAASVL